MFWYFGVWVDPRFSKSCIINLNKQLYQQVYDTVIYTLILISALSGPYFFLAVGSKANIGGAASAPVVAGAFHPSLAPVGVLLAVLGYALGTYAAFACALMMKWVS